jgi:dGTPase
VATACLCHDIGNTPFGHKGEEAISCAVEKILKKYKKYPIELDDKDHLTNFEANAYGLSLLLDRKAFNLTYASIGSFLKYPVIHDGTDCFEKSIFKRDVVKTTAIFKDLHLISSDTKLKRHPLVYILEAADDIGYIIMDLEDAMRSNIITFSSVVDNNLDENKITTVMDLLYSILEEEQKTELKNDFKNFDNIEKNHWVNMPKNKQRNFIYKIRSYFINNLVEVAVRQFLNNYDDIMKGDYKESLLEASEGEYKKILETFKKLKDYSESHIYTHRSKILLEASGFTIIENLLTHILRAVINFKLEKIKAKDKISAKDKHIRNMLISESITYSNVKDENMQQQIFAAIGFVAGMTDKYAIELYQRINGLKIQGLE